MDVNLMRMQYEILNVSFGQLAELSDLPASMIKEEAERAGWKQLWPEESAVVSPEHDDAGNEVPVDYFAASTDAYIESSRRRLKVYSLAKDIFLATKYFELESALINTAIDALEALQSQGLKAQDIKFLSAMYKDLTSGSNLANLAASSIGTDESGIPTLVIRDLSGQGK